MRRFLLQSTHQGRWPSGMNAGNAMTKTEEIIADTFTHGSTCRSEVLCYDDPMSRTFGWSCMGCSAEFRIPLIQVKKDASVMDQELHKRLMSHRGRIELAKEMSCPGIMLIYNERPEK